MDSAALSSAGAVDGRTPRRPGCVPELPTVAAQVAPAVGADATPACGLPGATALMHALPDAVHSARGQGRQFALLAISADPTLPGLDAVLSARLGSLCNNNELPFYLGQSQWAVRMALSAPHQGDAAVPAAGSHNTAVAVQQRALALQAALQAPVWHGLAQDRPQARLGLALFPTDADQGPALLLAAQAAAAQAHMQGGLRFFGAAANAPLLRQWQLGLALQHAVERQELTLLYQPRLSLDSGQIVGVEALLRWHPASFGEVSPGEFIPLAERLGLIDAIGRWSLHQACLQSLAWRRDGQRRLRVSVNISAAQLQDGDLARLVQSTLIQTGADPADLAIELTEDGLMANEQGLTQALRELKALGVEIALDNFGTGSSSLAVLQHLPIDLLNIDRSFVHDVTASPESVSMTRALITMAHSLQLRVLAEGVQTEGQLGLLAANGCDLVQGHLFSTAVPATQIEALMREGSVLPSRFLRRREQQRTLLLVDDEDNILAALKRLLRRDGYRIVTASTGDEGLLRLAEQAVDVIVSDQRMPGMSGVEFLRRAKALYPGTVRMTLSGFTDLQSIIDAVNEGAIYKFLTKPWDDDLLRQHVAEAFRQKELDDENKRLSMAVAHANAELEATSVRLASSLQAQREQTELVAASASGAHEMLDELPVAVLGIDPGGMVAYANRAATRLLPQVHAALGHAAEHVFPSLLGCLPPAVGSPVALRIGGRPCRAITQGLQPTAAAPQGRGRLVLLIDAALGDTPPGEAT